MDRSPKAPPTVNCWPTGAVMSRVLVPMLTASSPVAAVWPTAIDLLPVACEPTPTAADHVFVAWESLPTAVLKAPDASEEEPNADAPMALACADAPMAVAA